MRRERGTFFFRAPSFSKLVCEFLQQVLRFTLLRRAAFLQHFVENAARAIRIAHVDIGTRQIELGADLIQGIGIVRRFAAWSGIEIQWLLLKLPRRHDSVFAVAQIEVGGRLYTFNCHRGGSHLLFCRTFTGWLGLCCNRFRCGFCFFDSLFIFTW